MNALLSFILKRSGLSGTDRILGMGFGFIRGVFIVSLVIVVLKMTSVPYDQYSKESLFYSKFEPVVNWLQELMPDFIKKVQDIKPSGKKESLLDIAPDDFELSEA